MNGRSLTQAEQTHRLLLATWNPFAKEKRRVDEILGALRARQERRLLAKKNGRAA